MKRMTNIDEYMSVLQNSFILILMAKDDLEIVTSTDLLSKLETVSEKYTKYDFYIADIENLMDVAEAFGLFDAPILLAISKGEVLDADECGYYDRFSASTGEEVFNLTNLPDRLDEFVENIEQTLYNLSNK
ncbi:MAG: hypothetical protein IKW92_00755 [Firmicutes bacterium]|nr:hypothetical protein [Bacillota bacterium]